MRFYHYTSARHLPMIQRDGGLTKGRLPWKMADDKPTFIKNVQWLTLSPDWDQTWDRNSKLPYRRTEYRIGFEFTSIGPSLINWLDFCDTNDFDAKYFLNHETDPKNWYLFRGTLFMRWASELMRNPIPAALTAVDPEELGN